MLDVYEELELVEDDDYLAHYGILGMKWGVRRYQNPDGSLTTEGMKRYSGDVDSTSSAYKLQKKLNNADRISSDYVARSIGSKKAAQKARNKGNEEKARKLEERAKKEANTSKSIDSETWKIHAQALENGMDVKMSDAMRASSKMKRDAFQSQFWFGIPGSVVNATIKSVKYYTDSDPTYDTLFTNRKGVTTTVHQNEDLVVGKKYKVNRY